MISVESAVELIKLAVYQDLTLHTAANEALSPLAPYAAVMVKPRRSGRRIERLWVNGRNGTATLTDAVQVAFDIAQKYEKLPDVLEVDIAHSFRRISPADLVNHLPLRDTGLKGLILRIDQKTTIGFAPTESIASNRDIKRGLDHLLKENKLTIKRLSVGRAEVFLFDALQVIVYLTEPAKASLLFRGNRLLPLSSVTRGEVTQFVDDMSTWMRNQLSGDGRMIYKYLPSRGEEASSNNYIRQWMATICLNRMAERSGSQSDREMAERNLQHNLAVSYRDDSGCGLIVEEDKVKLGTVALAALALLETPNHNRYADTYSKLLATVAWLSNPNGSFRTFYLPADCNDNQNFYPGEALLLWAAMLDRSPDERLRERFLNSYRFYRHWFESNPNPTFVPWHTQAYCIYLRKNEDADMAAFVLAMNDWLLPMQQWESVPHSDLQGRFYSPERPDYGPPHASSTGIYLEGLADAHGLARRLGDSGRSERYKTAIRRGLRNLRQLQFRGDDDMFYISDRSRVFGGIRTEVYDNTIRVDNVQHGLMAAMRILDNGILDE